jgi:uncharacterized membrane protein YraQ (UPF0718 family)
MVLFLGQTGKIEIDAAKAFEAAFGSLGLWGWGALVLVAGILLGLLIGFLIRGTLGEGIETKGKIEKLPKTCQEAIELKEKLQKGKKSCRGSLKKVVPTTRCSLRNDDLDINCRSRRNYSSNCFCVNSFCWDTSCCCSRIGYGSRHSSGCGSC